jgi:hypothetical protein
VERVGQAQAQVAVERVVRGEDRHVILFDDVTYLEERHAHPDAECLGLARA